MHTIFHDYKLEIPCYCLGLSPSPWTDPYFSYFLSSNNIFCHFCSYQDLSKANTKFSQFVRENKAKQRFWIDAVLSSWQPMEQKPKCWLVNINRNAKGVQYGDVQGMWANSLRKILVSQGQKLPSVCTRVWNFYIFKLFNKKVH